MWSDTKVFCCFNDHVKADISAAVVFFSDLPKFKVAAAFFMLLKAQKPWIILHLVALWKRYCKIIPRTEAFEHQHLKEKMYGLAQITSFLREAYWTFIRGKMKPIRIVFLGIPNHSQDLAVCCAVNASMWGRNSRIIPKRYGQLYPWLA